MTLTIELTPEQEACLETQATARGLEMAEFAKLRLLENGRLEPAKSDPCAELAEIFAQWSAEDERMTPDEIERADAGWNEIDRGLAENPVTMREAMICADV